MSISVSLPVFGAMITFIIYSATHDKLPAAKIFSSLALFLGLRTNFVQYPMVVGEITNGWISTNRISTFLCAEENSYNLEIDSTCNDAVNISDADFTWETNGDDIKQNNNARVSGKSVSEDVFTLKSINISFAKQELVAIVGGVGSGKSSLLMAIAGEMRKSKGNTKYGGSISVCSQVPWIQNTSLRKNVTFNMIDDSIWLQKVLDACALTQDVRALPDGVETELEERGVTLSGGQKHRVDIARAIYTKSDIILLDDPLSSVDTQVGKHIFEHAICGLLRDKCRILVTHQLHILERCDRIIMLEDGRIKNVDTFDALMNNNKDFQTMMSTTRILENKPSNEDRFEIDDNIAKIYQSTMKGQEKATRASIWHIYKVYHKAAGSWLRSSFILVIVAISQGVVILTSLWLSWWVANKFDFTTPQYIAIYVTLGILGTIFIFVENIAIDQFSTQASQYLFHTALSHVLRSPMRFFDTTPIGQILDRFSKDVEVLDYKFPQSYRMFLMTAAGMIAIIILLLAYYFYTIIGLIPVLAVFTICSTYWRQSAKVVRQHQVILRSHVNSIFSEGLSGISTIRVYQAETLFMSILTNPVDEMNKVSYLFQAMEQWLTIRLDLLGCMVIFIVGMLVVTSTIHVDPAVAGVILSYTVSLALQSQFMVRFQANMENDLSSVERMNDYCQKLDQEAPRYNGNVDTSWPPKGEIEFKNICLKYRPGLPYILDHFSLHINAGESVGIVGRTGAGKSSLLSALFRIVEIDTGTIVIDGKDIGQLGLLELRSRMSIIPQDPTVFEGTVRSNLDPFNEYAEEELIGVLSKTGLLRLSDGKVDTTREMVPSTPISPHGRNLSHGQRQLLALARALLRKSQIVVCDEATSAVDFATDYEIQQLIESEFSKKGRTVICIAHRLKTVLLYDKIVLMDAGRVLEYGKPLDLWLQDSYWRTMCDTAGITKRDFIICTEKSVPV